MTDKQFMLCALEAQNYSDRDAYVSDMAMSSMWCDASDEQIPAERLVKLGGIYDAVNRSIPEIACAAGLSNRKLAERFCIPYRTVENWCGGQRSCPGYVRLMMQEILGILNR